MINVNVQISLFQGLCPIFLFAKTIKPKTPPRIFASSCIIPWIVIYFVVLCLMDENSPQFVVTDTLKVEVFAMPVTDLSVRYCYRMIEPVQLIWQNDLRISLTLNASSLGSGQKIIETELLKKYKAMIENSKHLVGNEEDWAKIKWLEEVNKIEVIECDLVARGAK